MNWRILVHYKPQFVDHRGESLKKEWNAAGHPAVKKIRTGQAYELEGGLSEADARRLAEKLLTDPITQEAVVFSADRAMSSASARLAEVWPKKGVSDPVAETVKLGARDLDLKGLENVRSGHVFEFWGRPPAASVKSFCEDYLMNSLVQKVEIQ